MDTWSEIRERYAAGGITQQELAEEFGVPLGSLRRRAAKENWTRLRSRRLSGEEQGDSSARNTRVSRQLALTDRMLDVIAQAMDNPDELYYHIEFSKSTAGSEFVAQRLAALNDERLCRIVRAIAEIYELQRMALGIHEYKDEISARKVTQDGELAARKLEIELLRLEGQQGGAEEPDNFLDALGLGGGGGEEGYAQS